MGLQKRQTKRELDRAEVRALALKIRSALHVFTAARSFRESSERWKVAARARWNMPARDPDVLRDLAALATVTAEYLAAIDSVRPYAHPAIRHWLDEAARYAVAFVTTGERAPYYDTAPIDDALVFVQTHGGLGVPAFLASGLRVLAWDAAFSWVSFVEAIDSGRARELEGIADADICLARRIAMADDDGAFPSVKGGAGSRSTRPYRERHGNASARRNDANAVSLNRRKVENELRAWLQAQPAYIIDRNENMAAAGIPNAITLTKTDRRKRPDPK